MEYITGNRWLNQEEMEINAAYVWNYLQPRGWTINAVAGMLGNMQSESHINPGIWQGLDEGNLTGGYGIVQWTPATKFLNWCDAQIPARNPTTMNANLDRILYEVENDIQWGNDSQGNPPPYSFYDFTQSTETPYTLGLFFLYYYERPAVMEQPWRGEQAEFWYQFLGGLKEEKKKKRKSYMYVRNRRYLFL